MSTTDTKPRRTSCCKGADQHDMTDPACFFHPGPDTERDERLREARERAALIRSTYQDGDHFRPGALDDLTVLVLDDAVVTAVRALHVPGQWETDGPGALYRDCVACAQPYPCWTVRALDGT